MQIGRRTTRRPTASAGTRAWFNVMSPRVEARMPSLGSIGVAVPVGRGRHDEAAGHHRQ
jgi:hypothetical protein